MNDTYFFERIVRLMHGEIRRYDKEGMIVARYAGSEPASDPFCTDEAFLKEVMNRPVMSKPDLIVENSCICNYDDSVSGNYDSAVHGSTYAEYV